MSRDTLLDEQVAPTGDDRQIVRIAYQALDLVQDDPARAASLAGPLTTSPDEAARIVARWTIGRAHYEQGHLLDARRELRAATAAAVRSHRRELEGPIRSSLAVVLVETGDTAGALRELDTAARLVEGAEVGRLWKQRAFVLFHLGRWDDALDAASKALEPLRAAGDGLGEARLLVNRGICYLGAGQFAAAEADFVACRDLSERIGQHLIATCAIQNLGATKTRSGDIPSALELLGEARHRYEAGGDPARLLAVLDVDLAEALLTGGLTHDAVAAARRAVAATSATGNVVNEADARLLLAQALLADGRYRDAEAEAAAATALFRRSRRRPWATFARYVGVQALVLAHEEDRVAPPSVLRTAVVLADGLEAEGWHNEALHVHTYVGRMALSLGEVDLARERLTIASAARHHGLAANRARAWHAEALLRAADGDHRGARRALRAGLAVVERHRATLGATELRANAAASGVELARLGVRMALRDGRPADVLAWAERWRAASLRIPPVRPPADEPMSTALAELRHLHLERRRALAEGRAVEPLDAAMRHVEASIVDRSRRVRRRHGDDEAVPSLATLRCRLGDAVLLCFIDVEGTLWAVRVDERRATLHELAPSESVRSESAYLMSSVRRLLLAGSHDRLQSAAVDGLAVAARRLDGMVFGAMDLDPDVPLIVVPPAMMHGLPWAVLPSLERRSFVVAPSASTWWQRSAPTVAPMEAVARIGMVAGPELPAGRREVLALAKRYDAATTLVGRRATTRATLDLLAESDLVHLAAHGTFRSDSPLFSSLRLADGPLTVYDLEQLPRVAPTIVLPSCHAATAAVRAGDELIGTATALLVIGVRSLVAPVGAVPDDATRLLMLDVHAELLAGARPAGALAAARRQRADDPLSAAAAGLFLCLGAAGDPLVRMPAPV